MRSSDKLLILGVDLAWSEKNISTACIVNEKLEVKEFFTFHKVEEFTGRIEGLKGYKIKIFIDAPLEVKNRTGIRECDREFLARGIPALPFNISIMKGRYPYFPGLKLKRKLIEMGIKYCGGEEESSFYEVYVYGILKTVFGNVPTYKNRIGSGIGKILGLLEKYGFRNLKEIKNHHQIDAIICTIPWFEWRKGKHTFMLYRKSGYCLFVPHR